MTAKGPPNPVPEVLDTQASGLWALQEGGLIQLKGGALPGCQISQQAGWVRGGGRGGQERVQRGRKQKARSFTTAVPLWEEKTWAPLHPPPPRAAEIAQPGRHRKNRSPTRGTETQALLSQTPCKAQLSPRVTIYKGDVKAETYKLSPESPALGRLRPSKGRRRHFRIP